MNNIEFPIRLDPKNIGLVTKFINEKMDIKAKILKQNLSQNRIDELPYKNISTHDRTGYKHAYIKITMDKKIKWNRIGLITNYYGGLYITEVEGNYYWTIEDYNLNPQTMVDIANVEKFGVEQISKELYLTLLNHNIKN